LIIESLRRFYHYYGEDFKVEYPSNSGQYSSLEDIADELSSRLAKLFLRDGNGRRPVFGDSIQLQLDPHFNNYLLFFECFHGENGRGVGASHQTGWTGLIARVLQPRKTS
ncbi:MAG TPA: glucosidase, partial [Puia sp.]|nr:glucosidase [Puia sp.]